MAASHELETEREKNIIRSVSQANTTRELDEALRQVFETSRPSQHIAVPKDEGEIEFIHLNDTTIKETLSMFPTFSTDVLAAALRRVAFLSVKELRSQRTPGEVNPLLSSLLATIGQQMMASQREQGLLGVYALADILQALTILTYAEIFEDDDAESLLLDGLTDTAVEMLSRHDVSELKKLGPIRILQCLQAMAKLGIPETPFHYSIYQQLLKPNASSRLPAKFLARGLDSLASVVKNRANLDDEGYGYEVESFTEETTLLVRSFMRRMRKQNVRAEATLEDLFRAVIATNDLWQNGGLEDLQDEAAIFGFTILRAILQKKHDKNAEFTPSQMATMMSVWATVSNKQKEDTVIEDLMVICENDKILEQSSLLELERIVSSIQSLQVTSHADVMRCSGKRLKDLVVEGKISPRAFNSILRCPVLLHRRNQAVMEPYIEACERALADKLFLERCDISEIANFLWFASIANWRHDGSLHALGQRMSNPRLYESCSPKLASRILATYTSVVSLPASVSDPLSEQDVSDLTRQLFHDYGGHLLSSKLSAAEVSSSLYAYAKASYFQDMGIFDHLLALMADFALSADAPSTRQLSQSLWSSGKMSAYESRDSQSEDTSYLASTRLIAKALADRAPELSRIDVTQCIWALGRLENCDEQIMSSFANRAMEMVPDMNAVEISNILWGLAKTRYGAGALVDRLASRLMDRAVGLTPREAATSLYALSRMRVVDEDVYEHLSAVLLDDIEATSAQGIANTLWAYRNVNLRPPPELLNLWAVEKLGLVSCDRKKI